jgi:outer membrane immunogenic protein
MPEHNESLGVQIMKKLFLVVMLGSVSTAALAADLPSRQAPPVFVPPPIFTWTGVYVGGQIGYEWGREPLTSFSSQPSGVVGGAHIGYNYQIAQFVYGLEGDVNGSSYTGTARNLLGTTFATTKIPVDGSLRGRVGIAWDRLLFYATGGATFAQIKDSFLTAGGFGSVSNGRVGWTVGGGVDYAITNNWSVRAEYRYTDYGRFSDAAAGLAFPVSHHSTDNRVQVGFSYKFDMYAPPAPVIAKY